MRSGRRFQCYRSSDQIIRQLNNSLVSVLNRVRQRKKINYSITTSPLIKEKQLSAERKGQKVNSDAVAVRAIMILVEMVFLI